MWLVELQTDLQTDLQIKSQARALHGREHGTAAFKKYQGRFRVRGMPYIPQIANAALFLHSDEASFVTEHTCLYGGYPAGR